MKPSKDTYKRSRLVFKLIQATEAGQLGRVKKLRQAIRELNRRIG